MQSVCRSSNDSSDDASWLERFSGFIINSLPWREFDNFRDAVLAESVAANSVIVLAACWQNSSILFDFFASLRLFSTFTYSSHICVSSGSGLNLRVVVKPVLLK